MAKLTISPTVVKVLQVIRLNDPVAPSTINTHVGDGDYASKHIWYLRKLGFEFTIQKDGRKIASYTLISEPENAESIRNTVHGAARKAIKAASAPTKAPKAPKAKAPKKTTAPARKVAANKSVADIKAANLAKLKKVGEKFKASKSLTDNDILNDAPRSTSFSIDDGWDSVEGLDLSKIL